MRKIVLVGASAAVLLAGIGPGLAQEATTSGERNGIHVLVRKNFADLWLFDDPTAPNMAEGAEFSFVRDAIADDDTWSVQGMVAVPYTFGGDRYGPVLGASIAPYIELNRQTHTGGGDETNVLTGGASGEIGFDSFGGANFFRVRLGATRDAVADTTAMNVVGEWLPVYDSICVGYPCAVPGLPIIFRFSPEMVVNYSNAFDSKEALPFSGKSESLLVGPEFTLVFKAFGAQIPFLNNLSGKITYRWNQEVYSGDAYDYFSASTTYNLDPDGHLGLTLGYERGRQPLTTERIDQVTLALTGKL